MNKHTPGPWSIAPIGKTGVSAILDRYGRDITTAATDDARLIAAAPELLAAAEAVLEDLEYEDSEDEQLAGVNDIYDGLAKAIAKAREEER